MMSDVISVPYQCAYCGEENEAEIDTSAASRQSYVEDCAVCCRPNLLHITISEDSKVLLTSEFDG